MYFLPWAWELVLCEDLYKSEFGEKIYLEFRSYFEFFDHRMNDIQTLCYVWTCVLFKSYFEFFGIKQK